LSHDGSFNQQHPETARQRMTPAPEFQFPDRPRPAERPPAALWNPTPVGESDATFRTLVESIADYAIFMLDVGGNVASWNAGAQRIQGYPAAEILGQHFSLFYTPEDLKRNKPREMLETATAMGRVEDEGWRLRKDGSCFWANEVTTTVRSRHGELRGFAQITRDITERKFAEQLRERHRLELQDYIDSMSTFNKSAQFAANMAPDQLMKTNFLEGQWFTFDPQVQARVKAAFRRACQGEVVNYDERILAAGHLIHINFSLVPVCGADGKVAYLVAEGRDITPLKAAEAALRQRSTDLENANRELESFSYSVSHDLRAPLRSIDGFTQALLEDSGHKLDPESIGYLQRVRGSSERMSQLIDSLLKLSQITRGDMRFDKINLSDLARSIVEDLRQATPERQVQVEIQDGLTAQGDLQLLRILLVNLLGNAWKFTRKTDAARIEFSRVEGTELPTFCVRDNGAGFDPNYAGRLFGPFQRLHDQSEYEGTGIGLATVQRIISRHGGTIRAEGRPGQGAAFIFTLPQRNLS
jgi:PAS domain S-box-containing protein